MNAKRIASLALLCAMALAVQYLESLLPPLVPGVPFRLGLANIFTLFALVRFSRRDALLLSLVRAPIGALLTSSPIGILYALAGSIAAWGVMSALLKLCRRNVLSPVGLSAAGAFAFQLGQLAVGIVLVSNAVVAYFPVMCALSIPAGVLTGFLCILISSRVKRLSLDSHSSRDHCCNHPDK